MTLSSSGICLTILLAVIMKNNLIFKTALVVLFSVALLVPITAFAQPKVVVLGDSLSAGYGINYEAGWVNLLEEKLRIDYPSAKVVNASISGDTSTGALARLPQILATHEPDLVVIEIGGNDGLRGVSPSILSKNLDKIVSTVEENSAAILVQMRIPLNYGKKYTAQFEKSYVTTSEKFGIVLAPFILEDFVTDPEYMQSDRIHPKVNAQPLIVEKIYPVIKEHFSAKAQAASAVAED